MDDPAVILPLLVFSLFILMVFGFHTLISEYVEWAIGGVLLAILASEAWRIFKDRQLNKLKSKAEIAAEKSEYNRLMEES